ncbi:hypothetical protein ABPG72_020622 [Tetrahymena utriculariae]
MNKARNKKGKTIGRLIDQQTCNSQNIDSSQTFYLSQQIKHKFQEFIVCELYWLLNKYNRSYLLSVILVIIKQFEIMNFNFNKKLYQKTPNLAANNNQYFKILIIEEWPDGAIDLVFYFCFRQSFISFFFKAYYHVIFIASIHSSLCQIGNAAFAPIINIVMTLIIQVIITLNDFDYRFVAKDYLSRRYYDHEIFFVLLKVICLFFLKYGQYTMLPYVALIFNFIKLVYYLLKHPLSNQSIQEFEFCLTTTNLYISLIFILGSFNNSLFDYILIILCCIPFSYFAGKNIFRFRLYLFLSYFKGLNITANAQKELQNLDFYLRYINNNIDCTLLQYVTSPLSIILEKIITEHHQTCKLYPHCFCAKNIGRYDITKEDIFGIEYRKQYLDYYILNQFRDQIKSNKVGMNRFYYSYITFCTNALKNQMISFKEILTLRYSRYNIVNLRHKQVINYLYGLACEEFEIDALTIQNSNQEKIIDVIDFDEGLEQCSQEYRKCLNLKYDFLQTIGRDYIKLNLLEQQASSLQLKRQCLMNELNKLFQKNSSSVILQNICEGFEECLIIEPIFTKRFEQQRKSGYFHQNKIPLYTENSAAIYITLLTEIGKIVKVSKNFKDVVPLVQTNQEAIGKNVSFIQPEDIAQAHNQILLSCLERKSLNFQIKNYPKIIGKDAQGWSMPYHIKIQLCMLGNFELGVCGWIKQIKDGCMYILTSMAKDDFKVMTMDQNIYSLMLQGYFSRSQIKSLRLKNIIPMLQAIVEKGYQGQTYETIVVQPFSFQDTIQQKDLYDEKIINQLFKSNLFNMKFRFYSLVHTHISFTIFQISSFKQLDNLHNKKEALKNFRIQIYDYMDPSKLTANFTQSLNSLNIIQDQSQKLVKTAQNINSQPNQIISLQNIKNDHKNEESNQLIQNQTTQESSILKEQLKQAKEKQVDINQKTKAKPYLNQIMETSKEHCNLENTPTSDFQQTKRLSIDFIEPLNVKQQDDKQKYAQLDSSTNRQQNFSEQLILGQETHSYGTFTNQFKQLGQNAKDSTPQILSVETHNIFSSDSLFFSHLSSNRKLFQNIDVNKTQQSKVDLNQISSPIAVNSFEEEFASKNNQNSVSYNTSTNKKYLIHKSKNISIQNNLTDAQKFENNQSHSHSNNTSKNIDKKTQDDKALFEEKDKEGSVKTGKTSRSTARQQIISIIRSKNNSYSVRFINQLGIFCIFVICVLNMASFFVQYDDQKQQKQNFEQIAWCFQIKRYISFAFGNMGLINGVGVKLYQFQSPLQMGAFMNYALDYNKFVFQRYKNLTNQLIQGDLQNIYVFNRVNSYNVNISFANVMNALSITYMPSILTQKLAQFQQNTYYMSYMLDQNNLNFGQAGINYNDIYIALDDIYDDNKQHFFDQVDTSKSIITIQLVIISIITGLFFVLIIPIYTYSMFKKEEILKLFATIPAEKIIFMMMRVSKYLDQQEQIDIINQKSKNVALSSINHIDKYIKNNTNLKFSAKQIQQFSSKQIVLKKPIDNMKKKNISSTNTIHKTNLLLLVALILFLVMTIFYPICNYIIMISQVNNFTNNLKFLNSFDYFIDNLASLYCVKCGYTFAINMAMFYPAENLDTYLQVAQPYTSTTQLLLDNMITNYQVFQTQSGYNSDSYNNFFYPFFKDDVCQLVFKSGQNHLRDVSLTFDQCKNRANGIFQKGYLVAIKTITNMFDTFYEVAYTKNATFFNEMNYSLQQQLPIDEEFKFIIDFMNLGDVLHNFFQDIYSNYHNYIFYLQIFLVSLQILTIFLVMIFAWRYFYNFLSKTYYKTKQLLDLIEINTILDNPYMLSYFKKNK